MSDFKLPRIGLRNIKTAISVCICLILFSKDPFFAAIASIMCMQDTVEHSLKIATNRVVGTLLGGLLGLIFLYLTRWLHAETFTPYITSIGVVIAIYLCNLLKRPAASAMSSLVLIAIMIAPATSNPFIYASKRTIETIFGITVSILVNKYIKPPKEQD
ncbi:FUSC family protein [Clostridium gasigenes]|uniref:FUSC family protein n=1 Tax=Clostridium gasigenes TaxID=94869 RepID=A0A7X0SE00_9CLOT|nr:aromatic acid exporter family protein [Clostridium gasigenes]MBB6715765.1 FUSC family protein [Clostridium gasigenes]MBU3137519.1 FUSC family protein [Clostridium gasigenes]